jgi:predicted metal-dependent phosphoesterase TrpH
MMYKYETHCHSSQCSRCGRSTSQELVKAYYEAGYAGLVLTDHFIFGNTAVPRDLPWETRMQCYYDAYLDACKAAEGLDFDVIFGIEHAYGDGKEVLIYGIDLSFLLSNPDIPELTLDELVDRVHAYGGIVVQAHPYRDRSYVNMSV